MSPHATSLAKVRRVVVPTALALSLAAGLALTAAAQLPKATPAPTGSLTGTTAQPVQVKPMQGPPPAHGAAPAPTAEQAANFPLKFEQPTFDWGDIPDTEKVTHIFKFTNTSDKTQKITGVQGSCGCTAGTLTKTEYAPNESGEITATFDPTNRNGPQPKTLTVSLADTSTTPYVLHLSSNVKPYVIVDQQKLQFVEILKGTESTQSFTVSGRTPDFAVTGVDVADPTYFTVEVGKPETVTEKEETLHRVPIKLTLKPAPVGPHSSQLTIHTNDTRKPTVNSFASAQVVGELRTMPPVMFIRANQPSVPFDTQVQLDNRLSKHFEISSVDVDGPSEMNLTADFEPATVDGRPGYTIKLSGVTPPVPGQYRGTVTVKTDVQDEGEIKLTFYANIPNANGTIPPYVPPAPGSKPSAAAPGLVPNTGVTAPTAPGAAVGGH